MEMKLKEKLKAILLKKAEGYDYDEKTEEFQMEEEKPSAQLSLDLCDEKPTRQSQLKLIKKKVTSRHMPPDLAAIKMLLDLDQDTASNYSLMSDQELFALRDKLVEELKNIKEEKK